MKKYYIIIDITYDQDTSKRVWLVEDFYVDKAKEKYGDKIERSETLYKHSIPFEKSGKKCVEVVNVFIFDNWAREYGNCNKYEEEEAEEEHKEWMKRFHKTFPPRTSL